MARKSKILILLVVGVLLLIAIVVSVIVATRKSDNDKTSPSKSPCVTSKYKKAAVAADAKVCSDIGADTLKKGGSAADAAIASMLCAGVINLQSCGIGGGSFMVLYERKIKKIYIYDFRESAPSAAHENMFVVEIEKSKYGGLASGIPGEVKGMWHIYQKHGKLPWASLFDASIKLAEDGFKVTKPIAAAIGKVKNVKYLSDGLRELITKVDGTFLKEGDTLRNLALGKTLRMIQKNATSFYTGELAKKIVEDINNASGNFTLEDLRNYTVKSRDLLTLKLPNGLKLNAMAAPGGGPIVTMIQNIMSGYNWTKTKLSRPNDRVKFYQRLMESMKFSYAQRGLLGDPDFLPKENISSVYRTASNLTVGAMIRKNKIKMNETHKPSYYGGAWGKTDYGTSHLSVLAENGDAVSVTSTINYYFGSLVRSKVTGIIYNNEMDDFSTPGMSNFYGYPPSPANYIRPGKRPLSSMSPSIVLDQNGDVRMVAGASGGSRIISGTAEVMLKRFYLNMELCEAVGSYRLHHQGIPNQITYSSVKGYTPPADLIDRLKQIGHKVVKTTSMCVVQAIYKDGNNIFATADPRKSSRTAGY